jgi:archaellum biogenesis protein FlaJ (TadC family)
MLIDTLVGNPWFVALLWGVLSIFDFVATMLYSKAYREFLSTTVQYEHGVEMNPAFEKDVRQLRWFSPRYVISMLSVAILIVLAGMWFPTLWFETLAGAALLLVFITDLRHIENLSMVRFLKSDPEGFKGRIEQSYKLSQRRVAVGVFNIGVLYLVVLLLTERLFFLGGGIICILFALRHYLLSNRRLPNQNPVS